MICYIKDKKLIAYSENKLNVEADEIIELDDYKKLINGCIYENGEIVETPEYIKYITEGEILKLNKLRSEELKGFIIDNIFINEDLLKMMAVEYSITDDTETILWIGVDNSQVSFSKAEFGILIKKGANKIKEIYFKYRQLKDDILTNNS